jgi:ATP citrate (pro-S)-lyase
MTHDEADECYLAIVSNRDGDEMLFYHQGGVDVGDVDAKAARMQVPIGEFPTREQIARALLVVCRRASAPASPASSRRCSSSTST